MATSLRIPFFTLVAVLACNLTSADTAAASWVTIKNDTGNTIIVQNVVVVGGQVKRGKPTTLLPGESLREFVPGPVSKQVEVFDATNPNATMWTGTLACKEQSQAFSVAVEAGRTVVQEVSTRRK
jgi:hypothetical protein